MKLLGLLTQREQVIIRAQTQITIPSLQFVLTISIFIQELVRILRHHTSK